MRSDVRNVFGQGFQKRSHQFRILLVGGVVGQLAETLGIQRFPDQFVEEAELLGKPRTHRVKVVLAGNDLGGGRFFVGIQVQPVGHVAQRVRGARDGHGDAVVPVAHTDVSDDERVLREDKRLSVCQHQVFDAQRLPDHRVVFRAEFIICAGIVSVLFQEFFL